MQKLGKQTIKFDHPPTIVECATIVGPKESDGPLAKYFDIPYEKWEAAIEKIVKPNFIEINKKAFSLGYNK